MLQHKLEIAFYFLGANQKKKKQLILIRVNQRPSASNIAFLILKFHGFSTFIFHLPYFSLNLPEGIDKIILMKFVSVFNDVMGPVMRGPSSSHTAASYRIGCMARFLFIEVPDAVIFTFDPGGSYAQVYRQQGVDLAFTAGIMGWKLTDKRFFIALKEAKRRKIKIEFKVAPLSGSFHPNAVKIHLSTKQGLELEISAKSTGGGGIIIDKIGRWQVDLDGKAYCNLIECKSNVESQVKDIMAAVKGGYYEKGRIREGKKSLLIFQGVDDLEPEIYDKLNKMQGVDKTWKSKPVFYMQRGDPIFQNYKGMVQIIKELNCSLGEVILKYESQLLGIDREGIIKKMLERFDVMKSAVDQGLESKNIDMQLLSPSAGKILQAEAEERVAIGGIHTQAAARAMAVMHINNSMGIVCAAPTGGSAGVIPGVMITLLEEKKLKPEEIALSLLAASGIGLLIAIQATFAAEIAGCQVEIGAAGAMAAAAVVQACRGRASDALDAAAIALQNTMGSVCDLVQGRCEIPCHTRNAAAASNAFVCADLIMGGYKNPIPLNETIDAAYSAGKMLPKELRCNALGGLAQPPTALKLKKQ